MKTDRDPKSRLSTAPTYGQVAEPIDVQGVVWSEDGEGGEQDDLDVGQKRDVLPVPHLERALDWHNVFLVALLEFLLRLGENLFLVSKDDRSDARQPGFRLVHEGFELFRITAKVLIGQGPRAYYGEVSL